MKKKIALILGVMVIACSACTYSINMAHTSGTATDLIDEEQVATPDISPTVTIPVSPI